MSTIEKSTAIEALSANVVNTRFENIDKETVENARLRIIDVIGCIIAGANAVSNPELVNLVKDWGGKEEATVLVHGGKIPAQNAAMVNSVMARSFDFEPVGFLFKGRSIPGHVSGTTVCTALTMGEIKGIDGKELITALLVGDDIAGRIICATGSWFNFGWDQVGTINVFAATAIAGKLLGLNEKQMRNAFGIALNQTGGSFQSIWDGTSVFKLLQGTAARNGIFSAQLAKAGWTGPRDALLGKLGYYKLYTEGCLNPEVLTEDLGQKYYAESHIKPYPCCGLCHPSIECALALVSKYDINTEDIEEVLLHVPRGGLEAFVAQPFKAGDFPHGSAAFNYRYALADVLLRKSIKPAHFSEDSILDPRIEALVTKIKLVELPDVFMLTNKLTVRMKDGRELSEFTDSPKGDPLGNPMLKEDIKEKFMANVYFSQTVSKDKAEKLLDMLDSLEKLDNLNKIIELSVK